MMEVSERKRMHRDLAEILLDADTIAQIKAIDKHLKKRIFEISCKI